MMRRSELISSASSCSVYRRSAILPGGGGGGGGGEAEERSFLQMNWRKLRLFREFQICYLPAFVGSFANATIAPAVCALEQKSLTGCYYQTLKIDEAGHKSLDQAVSNESSLWDFIWVL
uniref:Uncharacterized protein n=1 Tax=Oryza glumipatula TaxID=40148 RepID=A0A0E0A1H5_9ORYZ